MRHASLRRALAARGRRLLSTQSVSEIALDGPSGATPDGNVLVAERTIRFKPREPSKQLLRAETSHLFCASNDPLAHTEADCGKFFQLDGSTDIFSRVFYHTDFCGDTGRAQRKLRTSATLVRPHALKLRDELLGLHAEGQLGATAGLVVSGDAGVGKSSTLNHAIACCEQAGWLVVVVPSATDWTHGLDGRDTVAPCEAYRITDREYFTHVPPELEAAAEEAAAAAEAEGDHWAKAAAVTYEAPDASANFLVALAFSQMEKLDKLPVKDAERRAHYARPGGGEPSLGDMLRKFSRDECAAPRAIRRNSAAQFSDASVHRLHRYKGFAEFPMALRPVHDLLRELQTVTDIPVLVAVDGWNRWHQMSGAREWRPRGHPAPSEMRPLHAQQLLVPQVLGDLRGYGEGMANGVLVAALTHGGVLPMRVPRRMRSRWPHTLTSAQWRRDKQLPPPLRRMLRRVPEYTPAELQAVLELYAHLGHMGNSELQAQLDDGSLAKKVAMMTSGRGADVFRIAEQM